MRYRSLRGAFIIAAGALAIGACDDRSEATEAQPMEAEEEAQETTRGEAEAAQQREVPPGATQHPPPQAADVEAADKPREPAPGAAQHAPPPGALEEGEGTAEQ